MTPEQLANRNARIAIGQRRSWTDPEIRARRVAAIRRAWSPEKCIAMSKMKKAAQKRK